MFDSISWNCSDVDPVLNKDRLIETLDDDARNWKFETLIKFHYFSADKLLFRVKMTHLIHFNLLIQ